MGIPRKRTPMGPERKSSTLTNNSMIRKLEAINDQTALHGTLRTFKTWDADKDNSINFTEFVIMAKKIPLLEDKDEEALKEIFRNIDIDANGTLSIREFGKFWNELPTFGNVCMIPYPDKKLQELKGFQYVRQWLYYTLDTYETPLGIYCGYIMFLLIVLSVTCYSLETINSLSNWNGWKIMDACVSIIFTLEYVIRFIATRQKQLFVILPLNVIDVCSFLPFYVETILLLMSVDTQVHYFRVLRLCRITKAFRISRYKKVANIIRIFTEATVLARHSLTTLFCTFLFTTVILASLTYSAEESAGTFNSVFEAMYWCVITQTTLGYGDIPIRTSLGRLFACITAYIGILNLTFMINVLGSCFDEAYTRYLTREELALKEQLIAELHAGDIRMSGMFGKTGNDAFIAEPNDELSTDILEPLVKYIPALKVHGKEEIAWPNKQRSQSTKVRERVSQKELILKLTKLTSLLMEYDFLDHSYGYSPLHRTLLELRQVLDREIFFSSSEIDSTA